MKIEFDINEKYQENKIIICTNKITLIDTRYISPKILSQYIEFNDQDILFLYSTSIINNSYTLK